MHLKHENLVFHVATNSEITYSEFTRGSDLTQYKLGCQYLNV